MDGKKVIDLCGQALCTNDATHAMYWPGRGRSLVCAQHEKRAKEIAEAMGFELHTEPLADAPQNPAGRVPTGE